MSDIKSFFHVERVASKCVVTACMKYTYITFTNVFYLDILNAKVNELLFLDHQV